MTLEAPDMNGTEDVTVSDINATEAEQTRLAVDSESDEKEDQSSDVEVNTPPVPHNPADNTNLDPEANREQVQAHPRGDDFVARPEETNN